MQQYIRRLKITPGGIEETDRNLKDQKFQIKSSFLF